MLIALALGVLGLATAQLDNIATDPAVRIGMVIVIGVSGLMLLLLLIALVFALLGLANSDQALGLPEGSIRAMIALFLLLMFVIVGLYLFKEVATATDATLTETGKQMALTLLTILGTLTTAVAAFYFGTGSVRAAREAVEARSEPIIRSIEPSEGEENSELSLRVLGKNFKSPRSVKLVRGSDQIVASDILSNATAITCTLKIDKLAGGENWDVVVENDDGGKDSLEKAFEITPPEAKPPETTTPAGQPPAGQPPEEEPPAEQPTA